MLRIEENKFLLPRWICFQSPCGPVRAHPRRMANVQHSTLLSSTAGLALMHPQIVGDGAQLVQVAFHIRHIRTLCSPVRIPMISMINSSTRRQHTVCVQAPQRRNQVHPSSRVLQAARAKSGLASLSSSPAYSYFE